MKEIKNVVLCGLGGVGCVIATSIFDAHFANLKILIDEKRKIKYEKEPTTFNLKPYIFDYATPEETIFKADLIIIATKNDGLDASIKNIKNFIKEDTIIISVLNGIHSEAKIAQVYGEQKVLYSFFIGSSCIRNGRNITQDGNYELIIGDKYNPNSENIKLLSTFFERCHIKHKVSNHILERYWKKFMVNVGLNQLCTVENKTFKEIKLDSKLVERMKKLIWEVKLIAEKEGVENPQRLYDSTIKFLIEDFKDATPSMLQDLRAGRKTELDIFAGEVIRLGQKHKIQTPENKKIYIEIENLEIKVWKNLFGIFIEK